tara:strand:- start:314 stop:487 length:174 start_codon:yes stop_codon:yes gene_type:complete
MKNGFKHRNPLIRTKTRILQPAQGLYLRRMKMMKTKKMPFTVKELSSMTGIPEECFK